MEIIKNSKNFISEYCSTDSNQGTDTNLFKEETNNVDETDYLKMPVSIQELNTAIECSKKDSSPGLDQIDYKMLKNTPIT